METNECRRRPGNLNLRFISKTRRWNRNVFRCLSKCKTVKIVDNEANSYRDRNTPTPKALSPDNEWTIRTNYKDTSEFSSIYLDKDGETKIDFRQNNEMREKKTIVSGFT